MYLDIEIPEIVFVRNGADPGNPIAGVTQVRCAVWGEGRSGHAHGSAMSLSVSLIIRFGSAMVEGRYQISLDKKGLSGEKMAAWGVGGQRADWSCERSAGEMAGTGQVETGAFAEDFDYGTGMASSQGLRASVLGGQVVVCWCPEGRWC